MTEMTSTGSTENRCRRCGRKMRVSKGIGPRCAAIEAATQGMNAKQVDKVMEAVADRAIVRTSRKDVFRVVSSNGDSVHICSVNGNCTCEWGRRRTSATVKPCWAVAAARITARPRIRTAA